MKLFKTSDLALSAYLSLKYKLEIMEREGQKCYFYFEDKNKLQMEVEKFWNHKAEVEPSEYFNSLKEFKNRIHNI